MLGATGHAWAEDYRSFGGIGKWLGVASPCATSAKTAEVAKDEGLALAVLFLVCYHTAETLRSCLNDILQSEMSGALISRDRIAHTRSQSIPIMCIDPDGAVGPDSKDARCCWTGNFNVVKFSVEVVMHDLKWVGAL